MKSKNLFRLFVCTVAFGALFSGRSALATNAVVFETSYQQIVNAEDPESEIFLRSMRIARIRTAAQKLVIEFDQRLDELLKPGAKSTKDLFAHPAYAKLLAARQLKDIEEETLEYSLERAQENRKQVKIAKALTEALRSLDRPLLPASQEDAPILAEIDALVPLIKKQLIEPHFARATPSARGFKDVYPDSGAAGVINGTEYTTGRYSLTYDDGPSAEHTPEIIKNLGDQNLKATFFWLAKNTAKNLDVVEMVKRAGMVIGNHSYSHALLTKSSDDQLHHEINRSQQDLTTDLGFSPEYFRCPYGACGAEGSNIREMIADEGMISVIWNIDSLDWQDQNPQTVYDRVKKQMELRGRGIILFHDIHTQSVAASKLLMADFAKGVKNKTQRLLTVKQAIDELTSVGGMK